MTRPWLSRKAFESLVQEALKGLPHEFRQSLKNVAIEIEEEPNNQTLRALGIADDDPDELLGLYVGRSIQGHSFFDAGGEPLMAGRFAVQLKTIAAAKDLLVGGERDIDVVVESLAEY